MNRSLLFLDHWRLALSVLLCLYWVYHILKKCHQNKIAKLFAEENGCQPVLNRLPYEWPFAIDIFKAQYKALVNGNLLDFQAKYFEDHKLGPTFETKLLGQVGYFTTDPRNLEAMLQTQFNAWELGNSRAALSPMIGRGIFTQDGPAWKHSRETLRRQFIRIKNQDMSVFEGPVNELLSSLSFSCGVVDLQPAFFRFTLNTTVSLIFGEPSTNLLQTDHDEFARKFDYASLISAMRMRLADLCWIYTPPEYLRACAVVKNYATSYVEYALADRENNGEEAASKRHPFILDLLNELRDPDNVRDQLMNVLIAGRDTTACLMSWACYQLVRHPAALKRLQEEVQSCTQDGSKLTRAHIANMRYLQCVLKETNRLYTQIPVNVRIARNTTYLPRGGGPDGESPILIPKGTGVGFSAYHMHRDKALYGKDANEFRPERWEGPELKSMGFAYMPFHGGPRLCLGQDFALIEASYGLVRLIQMFPGLRQAPGTATLPPGKEKQMLTVVVSSAEGCKVLLR